MERPQTIVRFVGRARELARLGDAAAAATAGHPRVVLVAGEAGAGKSRLLDEFTARLRATDARVLDGACLPLGSAGPPYAPIVGVLRSLRRSVDPAALPAILGPGRGELGRLAPELVSRAADLHTAPADPLDPTSQTRLFELFAGAIERLARDGLVVVAIEDIHWADRSSRDLIDFVVRGLPDEEHLLLVLTCRTDDLVPPEVASWLAELERLPEVERLDLPPLARDDVAELVAEVLGRPDETLTERIAERAGGNPFLVEELALAGGDGRALPDQLRAVLLARLSSLPMASRDLLRAASASGGRLDDRVLGRVLGVDAGGLGTSIREATSQGHLVRVAGVGPDGRAGGYAFRHALVREAVYDELLPGERSALHAAYAEVLESEAAERPGSVAAADIAFHWDAAGEGVRALPSHVKGGREAMRVYAHAEARRHLDRALELWPSVPDASLVAGADLPDILDEAATATALDGDYASAVDRIRQALLVVDQVEEPARAGSLRESLRWLLWEAGDRVAAEAAVREALAIVPASPASAARARAVAHDAGLDMMAGRPRPALAKAREAVAMARSVSALPEEALGLGVEGWAMAALGRVDEGVAAFREALAIAELLGSVEGQAIGYANLVAILDRAGRAEDALVAAREGYAAVRAHGLVRTFGGVLRGHEARLLFHVGRWVEAAEVIADGLASRPIPPARLFLLIQQARLLAARGADDAAAAAIAEAIMIAGSLPGTEHRSALLEARVEVAVWSGRADAGRSAVEEAVAIPIAGQLPDPALAWVLALGVRIEADAAEAARAARDEASVRGAIERAMRAVEWARGWLPAGDLDDQVAAARRLDPRAAGIVALLRAEETRLLGRPDPEAWAVAADAWAAVGRPLAEAYARYRQGAASAEAGDRTRAIEPIRAAFMAARELVAVPLQRAIERLARQLRVDLPGSGTDAGPRTASDAIETSQPTDTAEALGLTPREREVLRLVAAGWSNPEIGDELGISRKTASVHVSNVLGKLGVENRVEAAVVAARLGLADDPES